MGFNERIETGQAFEADVEDYCNKNAVMVAKNGTEHTHPEFVENIRSNKAKTSKLIRYAPDGILLNKEGDVYHWEAKCSDKIEKDAYETYMKYTGMGHKVLLFCKHGNQVCCGLIENIRLIDGNDTVNEFPPERRHPVEDKWIYPRRGHGNAGIGSGTPYRVIDISSLKIIKYFCLNERG